MRPMKPARRHTANVTFDNQHPAHGDARQELLEGLACAQKTINPKYFYDRKGSELFDQITRLPEYYPTRTEMAILDGCRQEIAGYCGSGCVLIEPGSGSSEKVRLLLDAVLPAAYVPLDISASFLQQAALRLGEEFPWLPIHAVCADFAHHRDLPGGLPPGRRVVFYPGSTIGNLEPEAAQAFLRRLRHWIGDDGGLLVGVDLHKSTERLAAAYNDAAGVTAEFNRNLLHHLNRVLGADFDPQQFRHHAFYDPSRRRIEMHLVSARAQTVRHDRGAIRFASGESIHTENSYKYTHESFAALAAGAGLALRATWSDDAALFAVHYLAPEGSAPPDG